MLNGTIQLKLAEFEKYDMLTRKLEEFNTLTKKINSGNDCLSSADAERHASLNKSIPDYVKCLKLRKLSLEVWSFLKALYPEACEETFLKLVAGFEYKFFVNLQHFDVDEKFSTPNPLRALFIKHVEKIATGKILFG